MRPMNVCLAWTLNRFIIVTILLAGCDGTTGSDRDAQIDAVSSSRNEIAARIVTLSPHLAELIHDIGAGDLLVGVSAYTDYPPAVRALPVVGDAFALDLEQLAILQPDLLLAWKSGTPERVVDELRERGYRVAVIQTASLDDIPHALLELGLLTGHENNAERIANKFSADIEMLAKTHLGAQPINVFYQVAKRPLYTISAAHYVSDLIAICGGSNIFADLNDLAPLISTEAVLERDPEVLLASSDAGPDAFDDWDRWRNLAANRFANRFQMPADEIGRATPRLLIAAEAVCDALNESRARRSAHRQAAK